MFDILQVSESTKKKIIFLFLYSIIEFVCSVFDNQGQIGGLISTILLYVSIFWDRQLPLSVYIIHMILKVSTEGMVGTFNAVYISVIALFILYRNINNPIIRKYTLVTLYFFVVLFISYVTGINSHLDFAVRIVVASLIILQIASCDKDSRILIVSSVLLSGISMALTVIASLFTGMVFFETSTRLQFEENSKTLSTAIAPVIFSVVYYLLFLKGKRKLIFTIGLYVGGAVLSYLLIYTYSRGVLIALIISIIYLFSRYMKKISTGDIFFFIILAIAIVYFGAKMQVDNELMFENVEGGNGRTAIWADFIQQLERTNSIAFGFGPGFTKDISRIGFYSHSTILDYLFCYGIAGFLYILYLLFYVVFNLFKIKERHLYFYQGLYLLSVIMFSTHGSAGTLLFNVVLGLCMSVVVMNKNTRRRLDYIRK